MQRVEDSVSASRPIGAWIHGAIGWPVYGLWTGLMGGFIALGALLPDPHRRAGLLALRVFWGRLLWTTSPFSRVEISGTEHITSGPFVVVANHQSVLDIPLLYRLPLRLTVTARPGLFHVPVMGPFLRLSGQVNTATFFEQASAALAAGLSVAVFVEGRRADNEGLQRFHSGAFELAEQTGTPLLPVVLDGTRFILSRHGFMPWRTWVTVRVRVLKPVAAGPDAKNIVHQRMAPVLADLQAKA